MKGKIFNTQEVQAIIAGNKTQFREVIKSQPIKIGDYFYLPKKTSFTLDSEFILDKCPYQVGQKIFCKESFLQKLGSTQLPSGEHETFFTGSEVEYVADGAQERWDDPDVFYPNWWKKRPAQRMKQEHSRLTLQIKEIRVERLQSITPFYCVCEGVWDGRDVMLGMSGKAVEAFKDNWNATRKKPEEKFEASPWVWVIDFNVIEIE